MKRTLTVVASVLLLSLSALATPTSSSAAAPIMKVAASIAPLAGIVQRVGGENVETSILMPEGAEPHESQLPTEAVSVAGNSDLLVLAGHFPWESSLVDQTGKPFLSLDSPDAVAKYEDYGASLSPMPGMSGSNYTNGHGHEAGNPHGYWLVPRNAIAIANATRAALTVLNPTMSGVWDGNFRQLVAEISGFKDLVNNRDAEYQFSKMHAIVVTGEEAYVAETFGIKCDAVLQVENVFISAGQLLQVQDAIRNGTIELIIGSDVSRLQSGGSFAYQLAEDYGGTLIWVNTVFFSGLSDYVAFMTYNLGVLISALEHIQGAIESAVIDLVLVVLSGLLAVVVVIETVVLFQRARRD